MSIAFARLVEEEGIPEHEHAAVARDFTRTICRQDKTKQADKDSTDINLIVRRNLETGVMASSRQVPVFADISEITSLQDALQVVADAREFFGKLPARTREAFDNDPVVFVAQSEDEQYRAKFAHFGLIPKDEAVQARDELGRFAVDANKDGVADKATPSGAQ